MADNYVQFSQVLSPVNRRQAAWARRLLGPGGSQHLSAAGIRIDPDEAEDWPQFQWQLEGRELWIYSQEGGSPQHVGQFVRAFLRRFRPGDCWQMTWSETCSRPRVGEFGGGGVLVTARSARFFHAHQWVERQTAAFARRRPG